MKNEFVSYEIALALKELGFDEPCIGNYRKVQVTDAKRVDSSESFLHLDMLNFTMNFNENNKDTDASALTFSQAFRWFLKKHNLYALIIPTITMDWTFLTMTVVKDMIEVPPYKNVKAYDYSIKEEAEQAALLEMIELVKNK